MSGVYAKWKWCSKCEYRRTDVAKRLSSGVLMGIDTCDVKECGWRYVYPSIDRKRREIGTWCPYYAEAMVEDLNDER